MVLVQSYLNNFDYCRQLLAQIETLNLQQKWTGSNAYFLQKIGQTYTNLGNLDRAEVVYQQTLTFCQTGNYLQTQGRTLTSLAQLYRLQGRFDVARATHLQAIEILDKLGAKCDLAEAYYQAGLTSSQPGDLSQTNWDLHARQLFTEIAAPQQLAKLGGRG